MRSKDVRVKITSEIKFKPRCCTHVITTPMLSLKSWETVLRIALCTANASAGWDASISTSDSLLKQKINEASLQIALNARCCLSTKLSSPTTPPPL